MTFLRVICCSGTVLLEEMDRIDQIVAEANPNENIRSTLKVRNLIGNVRVCNSSFTWCHIARNLFHEALQF